VLVRIGAMKRSIISDQVSMDFERALHAVRGRFEYVEIHALWNKTVEDLSDDEAHKVEALIGKYRIGVSCLSTTLFLMCPLFGDVQALEKFSDHFPVFTGNVAQHTERMERCLELANRFDTDYIRIFPFRFEGEDNGDFNSLITRMSESLSHAVSLAEKARKTLLLENCPHSYLPRGNMCFKLATAMGSTNLMLLYDVGNSFTSERRQIPDVFRRASLMEEFDLIQSSVHALHFKDYSKTMNGFKHVAFGTGDINYEELVVRMKKQGYHGTVALEPEVSGADVETSIANFLNMV
jgi:sugar phosphate isomerase/epimerase